MSKRFLPTTWGAIPAKVLDAATVGYSSRFLSNLLPVQIGKNNYGDVLAAGSFRVFRFNNPDENAWVRELVGKLTRMSSLLDMVLEFELCCPDSPLVPDDFVPRIWRLRYTERD